MGPEIILHLISENSTFSIALYILSKRRMVWKTQRSIIAIQYKETLSLCLQVLQFPPALYHYITGELKKYIILVLNKVDLCPAPLVLAWKHYLTKQFPHLHCVCFTSHPGQPYSTRERVFPLSVLYL